jgi:hypothetical protein
MKKLLFSFCFAITFIGISIGQNYHPFTKNVGWCVEGYFGTGSWLIAYKSNGDTLINSFNYKKLKKDESTTFLIREDSIQKKVWVVLPDSISETLLYDFNLIVGNQITLNYVGYPPVLYQVNTIDTVSTPLGDRKRFKLVTTDTTFAAELHWIEGIGSTYSPIYIVDPTYPVGQFGGSGHCLICTYQNAGIQSYLGSCGIPFGGLAGSSCSSFITSQKEVHPQNNAITTFFSSSDLLIIESEIELIKSIEIFSIDGKRIGYFESNNNNNKESIQTNLWNKGIYLIKVTLNNNQIFTKKIKK